MKLTDDILELQKQILKFENFQASFDYLRITIASPKRIKSWAERKLPNGIIFGEVLLPETINFRSNRPEFGGLFCERIFGPLKNWKCHCGKYQGFLLDKVCDFCFVELLEARVRRYRMGYIELLCPIAHLWYFKAVPNYLHILLQSYDPLLTPSDVEDIIYFTEFLNPTKLLADFAGGLYYEDKEILPNELDTFLGVKEPWKRKLVRIFRRRGTEILKSALEALDIKEEIKKARDIVNRESLRRINVSYSTEKSLIRRIRILESFLTTKVNPSWLILTNLPVLPPNLRPLLELENGRLVAADVNEIYRIIITRNHRLFEFIRLNIPSLISLQGKKLLQEAVDSLIDNARLPKSKILSLNDKALKSLTETLEGKQGRFRQSLLGKRVDYSGRSVIVVGPDLRLNQCGLPYEIAVELFQPHLINQLLNTKIKAPSHNIKLAQVIIKKNKPFIWTLLESLMQKNCVLLNRAPTLHRFGIQAFDPVLVLGQAIHLHPLVCTGFNADFDGDQMAVHLPLSDVSQQESRRLMRPSYNVLSPSDGEVILKPTQDMVIGCYYLTLMIKKASHSIQKWFANENEVLLAFYQKKIFLHTPILVRYPSSTFEIKVEKEALKIYDSFTFFDLNNKEIIIYKILKYSTKHSKKYFLLTNIGIFSGFYEKPTAFKIKDLFLETTAGRILFSLNFKNAINSIKEEKEKEK